MPSGSFASMTDQHLAAILRFIRDYPLHERETDLPRSKFYLMGRVAVLTGMFEAEASVATRFEPASMPALDDPVRHGVYLAMNVCSECHGIGLNGFEGFTPPLTMAKAYSREQFGRLLSEGIGIGDRDLGLMSEVARVRFKHLEDHEVDDLYRYLQSR
jgi:mono/diheme cytochrome c family protein